MDARVAAKMARHAREGVTYPNPGALRSLPPEVARFQAKLERHRREGAVQGAEVDVHKLEAASASFDDMPTPVPPDLLPADHKRPTLEEFVARGYQAENYERDMRRWEHELVEKAALAKAETGASAKEPAPAKADKPEGKPKGGGGR